MIKAEAKQPAELRPRIRLSRPQAAVYFSRTPIVLDMAGQGAGKTENIGVQSADFISQFPEVRGFIGANTYLQLSQSTLNKAFNAWSRYYGWEEYDKTHAPGGFYVIDKKPPPHFKRFERLKKYNNTISFANGCIVYTGSLDNFKAHDGKEFGWAHLDETKDTKKEALTHVILARLRQQGLFYDADEPQTLYHFPDKAAASAQGRKDLRKYVPFNPCYIHTSPSYGGIDWLIDLFKFDKDEQEIRETLADPYNFYHRVKNNATIVIYQSYWNEENLPANYIENRRAQLTEEEQLMLIDGYPFSKTGNEYFPEFSRRKHVVDNIPIDFNSRFHVTYDFNVMPYVTQVLAQVDEVVRYIDRSTGIKKDFLEDDDTGFEAILVTRVLFVREFCMRPPQNETEQAADFLGLFMQANNANADVAVYGDASGHNRITGMGALTQFKIIERVIKKYYAAAIHAKRSNVSVLLRKKLLNRILAGKFPEIEIYFDSSCEQTIRDFEFLKQDANGKFKEKEIDKATGKAYEKIGHTSDAVEYLMCVLFYNYLKFID